MRRVAWFSCGVASAVAAKLSAPDVLAYCDTHAEHPDNERFLADCEQWIGLPVTRLASEDYIDTWDVWTKRRYLAGVEGALCTVELKISPRLQFQKPDDIHIFGYTAEENARADRLRNNYPELGIETPLIVRGITKEGCLAMVQNAGIALPVLYGLGFPHNNCLPCVKATSPAYWALVRKHFPEKFERMAKLARELDVRLCRINGDRAFIDEIPLDHPITNPLAPMCDFLCQIAEQEIA